MSHSATSSPHPSKRSDVESKDKGDPIAMKVMRLTKPSFQFSGVNPLLPLPGDILQSAGRHTTGRVTNTQRQPNTNASTKQSAEQDPVESTEQDWTTFREERLQRFIDEHQKEHPEDSHEAHLAQWHSRIDDDIEAQKRAQNEQRRQTESQRLQTSIVPSQPVPFIESDAFNMAPLLGLPQTFGDILMGETFSCYISIHNHSDDKLKDVSIKAEIQTSHAQKIVIADTEGDPIREFVPNARNDYIVKYEVEEAHILVCICQYTIDNVRKFFRKYFRFSVGEPFHIETKTVPTMNGLTNIVAISNISPKVLSLESVEFVANKHFVVTNLSPNTSPMLGIGDSKQYLHQLTYRNLLDPQKDELDEVGYWVITWRGPLGERGVKKTGQVKAPPKSKRPVSLYIHKDPGPHFLQKLFRVTLTLVNRSTRPLLPFLSINAKNPKTDLLVVGQSSFSLPVLEPHSQSSSITLQLVGLHLGLLHLTGITIADANSNESYDFQSVLDVEIQKSDEIVSCTLPTQPLQQNDPSPGLNVEPAQIEVLDQNPILPLASEKSTGEEVDIDFGESVVTKASGVIPNNFSNLSERTVAGDSGSEISVDLLSNSQSIMIDLNSSTQSIEQQAAELSLGEQSEKGMLSSSARDVERTGDEEQ